ncbi:MAG: ArsR family transcriptional regulator [Candidatus Lokiarchaeota archaeon]|nr:ArsR family transcriptional regulator [Candidatus Lokiarchaeota archaeon]
MISQKSNIELEESIEEAFTIVLGFVKAIGNESRLLILLSLLTGEKSFNDLMKVTALQKTALANHLTKLIDKALIRKPSVGNYMITEDGRLFLRGLDSGYKHSSIRDKNEARKEQSGQFSDTFISYFFANTTKI